MSADEVVLATTESSTDEVVVSLPAPSSSTVNAASPDQELRQSASGETSADELPSTSTVIAPPPGYRLVTLRIQGQSHPVVENLPVEVLPCHSFVDLCAAALKRVPDAPREYGVQASLVLGQLVVPLEHPHTSARDTLCSFSATASLLFDVEPGTAAGAGARMVQVTRLAAPRRRRRWLRTAARVAVGVAKFVLAVEGAALLRGSFRSSLRQLTGRGGGSSEGGGVGSETEAVLDAVVDYVSGRGPLSSLQRFDPRVVRGALEALDTDVLEQLDVPNVVSTRAAVSELLRQLREEQAAGSKAAALPGEQQTSLPRPAVTSETDAEQDAEAGPSSVVGNAGVDEGAGADGSTPNSSGSSRPSAAGEGLSSAPLSEPAGPAPGLPGFGPSSAAAASGGAGSGTRFRGRGGGV